MDEEGLIKFKCIWKNSLPKEAGEIEALNKWRRRLYEKHLIGVDDHGIGFGNMSVRLNQHLFLITGSGTGRHETLTAEQYSKVTDYDFTRNQVSCEGRVKASSESLTHAMIYQLDPRIRAVVHVHSSKIWHEQLHMLPTTSSVIAYGTVDLAENIQQLSQKSDLLIKKILIMGGHQDGIFAFGADLKESVQRILYYYQQG